MTALPNRAKPIPEIVARSSEFFCSRETIFCGCRNSRHYEFHKLLTSLFDKRLLFLASYEYCAGLAESYWNAIVQVALSGCEVFDAEVRQRIDKS